MQLETDAKLAIYRHFAQRAVAPSTDEIAEALEIDREAVPGLLAALRRKRVLWLEDDGRTIRMAPPFSAVETQHRVEVDGRTYFANCAWDAFGIPAALHRPGVVRSRCEQTREPLELEVGDDGPPPSSWWFHCRVPAAHWWDDLVFT